MKKTFTFPKNAASRTMADLIENSKGQFYKVTFIKKDMTVRDLTGKNSSAKDNHGGERTVDASQYILAKEASTGSLRNVNKDTILRVSCGGMTIENKNLIEAWGAKDA